MLPNAAIKVSHRWIFSNTVPDKKKEIKRSTIDVSHVPGTVSAAGARRSVDLASIPGLLDPLQFAKARTAEVLLLKKEIQESALRGTRRVFQTLPRSMRRRAASYNMKRLPVRLRQKALQEVSPVSTSAC